MKDDRSKIGTRASVIGICLNVILATVKLVIGVIAGSVSIIGDAANNYSDVASSVVTLISFKLSGKRADKEHPYGHGRAEYIAGFIVSVMVIAVALDLAKTSIANIISGSELDASLITAILLIMSIIVKFMMSVFYSKTGRIIGSSSMKAAATDSRMDCITTSVALFSIIVMMLFDFNIDGYSGFLVALFVMWQGIKSAKETMEPLIGGGTEEAIIAEIKDIATSHESILDVHDIRVHDYGPGRSYASMHAELPYDLTLSEAHEILDEIETEVVDKKLVSEITIHADPVNYNDPEYNELRAECARVARELNPGITIHDFHIIKHKKYSCVIFDVCVPYDFDVEDFEVINTFKEKMTECCCDVLQNDTKLIITVDRG